MTKSWLACAVVLMLISGLVACTHNNGDLDRLVDSTGRDFSRLPDANWVEVPLSSLRENPHGYKLMRVRFYAILGNREGDVFVPGYVVQKAEDYHNFSVWAPEARLWRDEDRANAVRTLYLHRDHPDMQELVDSPKYSLVLVRGVVSNDFEGIPFIHVHYYDVIVPGVYTDATLAQMARGLGASEQPARAIGHLESALEGSLAGPGRMVAHLQLAAHYEDRGDYQNAIMHFDGALKADPRNPVALEGRERCAKELARISAIEAGETPEPEPEP